MTIISVDGPSGSGKSTISKKLAEVLSLPYLDTGAMYRVVGLVALRREVDFMDDTKLTKIAAETKMLLLDERDDGKVLPRVTVAGVDETVEIRTPEVSQAASAIAIHPKVRERLVARQRIWVENRGGGVVEGRDIGTVVFPNADFKVFLTASEEERVKRRLTDREAPEFAGLTSRQIDAELAERDKRDSSRKASPLAIPEGAFVFDSSGKEIGETVREILTELRKHFGGELPTGTTV